MAELKELRFDGDGSHCGLTDLYPEVKALIEKHWGETFKVHWGSKKAIASAGITKHADKIIVWAGCSCDEGFDLIDDAVWAAFRLELCGGEWEKICEEIYEVATDPYGGIQISDPWFYQEDFAPLDGDLDDSLEKIDELWNTASTESQDNFDRLIEMIKNREEQIRAAYAAEQQSVQETNTKGDG